MKFTEKDIACAWTLAKLEDVRRSMKRTLLDPRFRYKPAASHNAPPKTEPITRLRRAV